MDSEGLNPFSTLTGVSPKLTNDLLSDALTKWFNQLYTFTHWEYVSDTGKGDSYLSEVIRIRIWGATQSGVSNHVQVILKNIPRSVSRRKTFRSEEFFKNEINFYNFVLPELLKFQSLKEVSDRFDNCAKLFLSYSDGVNDVICLEDVSLYGFSSAVRQEGVDLHHCKAIFKTLAKFHAMSFAMKDQKPEEFNKIRHHLFETYYAERLWSWYEQFWKKLCNAAIDAVEKEDPNSIYVEKVKKFAAPETYQEMIKAVETHENGAILHGDTWTNNFLFKYDNSKAVDAKMIDFQLSRCASPLLDLSFVFFACTTSELRDNHYDELLKYYHDVLSKQVFEMGSDPAKVYPWDLFMKEVKKYSFFGLAFSFESTPFIILPPEEAFDMDMPGEEKRNLADVWDVKPFKTKEGRLREANNVKFCVDRGYI